MFKVLSVVLCGALLAACSGPEMVSVSEKEYGLQWPLVVPEAQIGCREGQIAYLKTGSVGSERFFALNGNAIRAGLTTIDAIKKPMYANTVMAADFTEKAMKLCQ